MNKRKEARFLGIWVVLAVMMTMGCHSFAPPANQTQQSSAIPLALPDPGPTVAQRLLVEAQDHAARGDLENALHIFEQALEENPKLLAAYLGAGKMYQELGNFQHAEARFEQATRIAPTSFNAHYYLGLMRQMLNKFESAIRAYLYALAIDPTDFRANHHLASSYLQLGRPAEAVPYARAATRLEHDSQAAWANLATAYSLMHLYDKAIDAYRQANELGDISAREGERVAGGAGGATGGVPGESHEKVHELILLGLSEAHSQLGHYDRAMAVLQMVLKESPSALAHERMGYALFKTRQYDKALKHFRAALLFDPNDTAALNGMGVCMMTRYIQSERRIVRHRRQAMAVWQRSIEIHPDQPRISALMRRFGRL